MSLQPTGFLMAASRPMPACPLTWISNLRTAPVSFRSTRSHYHSGTRYVLGDQLAAMVTATAAEATRATAAEQKVAADLVTESSRAVAAEAKVAADLATEVQRANAAEGTIIAAVTAESTERKNADTVAATALALEISQRTAADASISQDLATAVQDLAQEDSNLSTRIDGQEATPAT